MVPAVSPPTVTCDRRGAEANMARYAWCPAARGSSAGLDRSLPWVGDPNVDHGILPVPREIRMSYKRSIATQTSYSFEPGEGRLLGAPSSAFFQRQNGIVVFVSWTDQHAPTKHERRSERNRAGEVAICVKEY